MNKQNKSNRFTEFFAGKGFYVVLFICIAAVGLSGYVLFYGLRNDSAKLGEDISLNWTQPEVTTNPARVVTPAPLPTSKPATAAATNKPSASASPRASATAPPSSQRYSEEVSAAAAPTVIPAPPDTSASPSSTPKPEKTTKFYWPVSGDVAVPHSLDELIKNPTMGDWRTHTGVDIDSVDGAAVCATADGKVLSITDDPKWGTTITISHAGGLTSTYSGLLSGVSVTIDASVKAGDVIGGVGNSAATETEQTPHLHFEMQQDGKQIDPLTLLPPKAN